MSTTPAPPPSAPSLIRETSSPSVRLFWLDIPGVMRRLRRAARRLAQTHPEIEEIWLFGSLARGEATPASDADIVLVLSHSSRPFLERPPDYALEDCGVATDILAYTRAEMERMRAQANPFLRQIESERRVLWQRGRGIEGRE